MLNPHCSFHGLKLDLTSQVSASKMQIEDYNFIVL